MKITIITVCYNSEVTIEDTIVSVINQNYRNIEYIIVDGNSVDNTLNILERYKSHINLLISEPDNGLYDAMNKGIKNATGDIIGILNSDDVFYSETTIANVVNTFKLIDVDAVFGDLVYVSKYNLSEIKRHWCSSMNNAANFVSGWHPPHPSLFIKKKVYNKYGSFDLKFSLASDFELMFRFFHINDIKYSYLPETIIKMRLGGETNKSLKNIIKQNLEILNVFKKYNIKISPLIYLYQRLFPKFVDLLRVKLSF